MACKFGINLDDCRSGNATLIKIGFPTRLHCRSCQLDEATTFTAEVYQTTKYDLMRRRVVRWFKKLQIDTDGFETGTTFDSGFSCPIIKETIHTSCSLEKCAYHIDYPWAANCLLAYAHQQSIETLSPEEISYLYQMPVKYVKETINKAISTLRSNSINQHATGDSSFEKQFTYFITDKVCCVCESALEEEISRALKISSIGAVYCSKECRNEMHPLLVELEARKGIFIAAILEWTFRRYKSLSLAEQSLKIPRWLAYEACRRYLDRPLDYYFPDIHTIQKHRSSMLVRRTWKPHRSLHRMMEKIRPISQAVSQRFGPQQITFVGLRRELNHLLQRL